MLSCRKATRLLSASLGRPLGRVEDFKLRLHLVFCPGCRGFRAQLGLLQEMTRSVVGSAGEGRGPRAE